MVRWRLVPSLFSFHTGVLATQEDDTLPPSNHQIHRCWKEIRYFSYLLDSGSMDPLPNDDSILVKLIHRAINLDVKSVDLEKRWSRRKIMRQQIKKKDFKLACGCWRESEHMVEYSSENCLAKRILEDYNCEEGRDKSIFSLSSSSFILLDCLRFISSWIARVPNKKKARWSRLQDSFSSLVKGLTHHLNSNTEETKEDEFASCFPPTYQKPSKESRVILGKRESVATIIVGIIHSCITFEVKNHSKMCLPMGSVASKSCLQVSNSSSAALCVFLIHSH